MVMKKKTSKNLSKRNVSNKQLLNMSSSSQQTTSAADAKIEERSFFKRWFRWDRLAAIATVIMLIVTLCTLLPSKEIDIIKKRINENIAKVESTFNPQQLMVENDSSEYLSMLCSLQQNTLDFCTLWKSIEYAEPYAKYADLPVPELVNVLQRDFDRMSQINEAAYGIIECIRDIQTFEALTDSAHLTKISHAKQNDILEAVNARDVIDSLYRKRCLDYIVNAQNDKNRNLDYKKNLRKGLEQLDNLKEEIDHYRMDDAILDYVLECNELFVISKRHFIGKKAEKKVDEILSPLANEKKD